MAVQPYYRNIRVHVRTDMQPGSTSEICAPLGTSVEFILWLLFTIKRAFAYFFNIACLYFYSYLLRSHGAAFLQGRNPRKSKRRRISFYTAYIYTHIYRYICRMKNRELSKYILEQSLFSVCEPVFTYERVHCMAEELHVKENRAFSIGADVSFLRIPLRNYSTRRKRTSSAAFKSYSINFQPAQIALCHHSNFPLLC